MSNQTLFKKSVDVLAREAGKGNSLEPDSFEARLPYDIDPAILDGLTDLGKDVIVRIANSSQGYLRHFVYNDLTIDDEVNIASEEHKQGLARIMYDVSKRYEPETITGLNVAGAPPAIVTLEELEQNTGCKTHYEYFRQRAGLFIDDLVGQGRLSIHDLYFQSLVGLERDEFVKRPFTVAIDTRYIKRINAEALTGYVAALILEMRKTLREQTQERTVTVDIEHVDYGRIGGGNAYCLRLIDTFARQGFPIEGDLRILQDHVRTGLQEDLSEVIGSFIDLDRKAKRESEARVRDDMIGYLTDAGFILRTMEQYEPENFSIAREKILEVPNLINILSQNSHSEYHEQSNQELAYLKQKLGVE